MAFMYIYISLLYGIYKFLPMTYIIIYEMGNNHRIHHEIEIFRHHQLLLRRYQHARACKGQPQEGG